MSITIRTAEPRDAEQMIRFAQQLSEEADIDVALVPGEFDLTVEQEQKIISEYAASENSTFLLAEADRDIVGLLNCLGGKRDARRHVTSLGISVRRDWRNRGVGDALIQHAIRWALGTGIVSGSSFPYSSAIRSQSTCISSELGSDLCFSAPAHVVV